QRRVELVFRLELVGAADVLARRTLRGPLERNLVFRPVGVRLDRPRVLLYCGVPVARPCCLLALAERAARGAPRDEQRENDSSNKPVLQHQHSMATPVSTGLTYPRIPDRTCESSSG